MVQTYRGAPWMTVAASLRGTTEIPGPTHSTRIVAWLKKLGAWWADDETPWCGVFVAHCMQQVGLPFPSAYYRAKAWADYGSNLARDKLAPGAILVFDRQGGGHVGLYAGENDTHYAVLGGNQANAVNISKIKKERLTASRWPKGVPVIGKPVRMTFSVQETTNER